jgi:uncharacterized membrane protein
MSSSRLHLYARTVCTLVAALILPALGRDAKAFTPTYVVTDLGLLPVPGYSRTICAGPRGLNDRDEAIGFALATGSAPDSGVLFKHRQVIDLSPTATASNTTPSAINARGQIVGYFYDGQKYVGFLYNHGVFTSFEAPNASLETDAEALNDVGQIAGCARNGTDNDHIFVREANGSFRDLGGFGIDPYAAAINNQGRVLFTSSEYPLTNREHTYISRPGSASLEEIPSFVPNGSVSGSDMNQFGVVVGSAVVDTATSYEHAFAYFEGRLRDLGVGTDDSFASGINDFGTVVGSAIDYPKPIYVNGQQVGETPEISYGWVTVAGKPTDVNSLLDARSKGWVISEGVAVNDRGQILANANFNGGDVHVVLLTPNAILPADGSVWP